MEKKTQSNKAPILIGLAIGVALVAAWGLFLLFFVARQYEFARSEDGRMTYGVCDFRKDAFCIGPVWDGGENRSFEIPDEFMGFPVTKLGGYTGRGYPCPFSARIEAEGYGGFTLDDSVFASDHREDDGYESLVFSVRLGKNVREVQYVYGKSYLGAEREDGTLDVLYKIVYSFTVDGENGTFYAENGRLYYKANSALVDEFFYE